MPDRNDAALPQAHHTTFSIVMQSPPLRNPRRSPCSSFLRSAPKLLRCRSFSLGGFFSRQHRQTQSPRCRGLFIFCAISRNYLRGFLMFACASSGQDAVRRCLHIGAGILLPRLPLLFASRKCKALPLLLVSPLCSETIAVSLIFARRFLFAATQDARTKSKPALPRAFCL